MQTLMILNENFDHLKRKQSIYSYANHIATQIRSGDCIMDLA